MQTIHFPNILAFVEGHMERLFVNNNFRYVRVIPIENGRTWPISALAKQIASKFYVRNASPDLVIVWVDKEERDCSIAEMRDAILDALVQRGADQDRIRILIPDRMTENIILSDEILIRDRFGFGEYKYNYEGQSGKSVLKRLFEEQGVSYKETFHGVKMLKDLRLRRCVDHSGDIGRFLNNIDLDCWWLK